MMTEYISRDAALPDACCNGKSCQECLFLKHPIYGGCELSDFIFSIPSADVVPVVRCKDCRYFEDMRHYTGLGWCTDVGDTRSKDWYCADGERREYHGD
jgi:hypothetical protein